LYFIGVDHHKQVSVMTVLDEDGRELRNERVVNLRSHVQRFLEPYRPFTAVLEAGRRPMADLQGSWAGGEGPTRLRSRRSPMPGSRPTSGTPGRWRSF
jgi:hypothetical protein